MTSLTCHVAGFCQWGLNPQDPRSGCQGRASHDCHFPQQKVNFSPAAENHHHLEMSLHCKYRWGGLVSGSLGCTSIACSHCSISSNFMFHWSTLTIFLYYSNIKTKTIFKLWNCSGNFRPGKYESTLNRKHRWVDYLLLLSVVTVSPSSPLSDYRPRTYQSADTQGQFWL